MSHRKMEEDKLWVDIAYLKHMRFLQNLPYWISDQQMGQGKTIW